MVILNTTLQLYRYGKPNISIMGSLINLSYKNMYLDIICKKKSELFKKRKIKQFNYFFITFILEHVSVPFIKHLQMLIKY